MNAISVNGALPVPAMGTSASYFPLPSWKMRLHKSTDLEALFPALNEMMHLPTLGKYSLEKLPSGSHVRSWNKR